MKKIAFIGAGNMGAPIVRAVCQAAGPESVVVYRPNRQAAQVLAEETGCTLAESGAQAVRQAGYVLLCVKPQVLPGVLGELLPALKEGCQAGERPVIVSIAAGVTVRTISDILSGGGLELPVIRLMPNTPVTAGQGVVLMAPGPLADEDACRELETLLAPCGLVERVTEHELDLGSAISGCGPAFVYLFIEALADGGVEIGLPRAKAQRWAAQMVSGAAQMVLRSGKHPGALKDEVCSPGGTTIAGVAQLEKCAFRSAAAQAVAAAYRRNCELGK